MKLQIKKRKKTNEEILELIRQYKETKDESIKNEIIEENLLLVASQLHRFRVSDPEKEDLFQVGVIGLIHSIEQFDLSKNLAFSTYAIHIINGFMKSYLTKNNSVRYSRNIKENMLKLRKFKEQYFEKYQKEAEPSVIKETLGLTDKGFLAAEEALLSVQSIDQPINYQVSDKPITLGETISDEYDFSLELEKRELIFQAFSSLTPNEKELIEMRFFKNKRQNEVADSFGVSQAHISRLEKKVLQKMKECIS